MKYYTGSYIGGNTAAGSEACSGNKLKLVPTCEGIATGQPIYMEGKSEARFYLPTGWLRNRENCYPLKVQGDSMIDAGINVSTMKKDLPIQT